MPFVDVSNKILLTPFFKLAPLLYEYLSVSQSVSESVSEIIEYRAAASQLKNLFQS